MYNSRYSRMLFQSLDKSFVGIRTKPILNKIPLLYKSFNKANGKFRQKLFLRKMLNLLSEIREFIFSSCEKCSTLSCTSAGSPASCFYYLNLFGFRKEIKNLGHELKNNKTNQQQKQSKREVEKRRNNFFQTQPGVRIMKPVQKVCRKNLIQNQS